MLADKLKSNKISDFTSKMYEKEIGGLEMMMAVCMHYQLKDGKQFTKDMKEFGLLGLDKESPLDNEIVLAFQSAAKSDSNSVEILDNLLKKIKQQKLDIEQEIHKLEEAIKTNPLGDYSLIYYKEHTFIFTPMQASAIKFMHRRHEEGVEEIDQYEIMTHLKSHQKYLERLFKGHLAWGIYIIKVRNHYYKLADSPR